MGREMSWQYMRDNWQKIKERFTGSFMLQRLVSSVCSGFASEERAKEVEVCMWCGCGSYYNWLQEFFIANPVATVERTVKQCCEAIRLNAQWLDRDREAIAAWLNKS